MKVSGQGKLEFESDLSKMLIKTIKNNDFAEMMLPLKDSHCTFKKVCKPMKY